MGYWDRKEETKKAETEIDRIPLEQLEKDCKKELTDVELSFRDATKNERKRFQELTDTGYWFCVCFNNRAQREEFMLSVGLDPQDLYIDGKELARAYKKTIKTPDIDFGKGRGCAKEYLSISMGLPETRDD